MATAGVMTETPQDAASKPPSDIVLPPSNMRNVIEKTASYIARNGSAFEDKLRRTYLDDPNKKNQLAFINEDDPYHGFYVWRVKEIREGRGNAPDGRSSGAAAPIPEAPKGPEAPPEFHFSARMPNISAQDLDVVRITALWSAKNGRSFITALSQKETGNFQFDFLRPQHSLYQFFSRLVDQYAELLNVNGAEAVKAETERKREIEKIRANKFYLLERAKKRAEYVKFQEQQKARKEEKDEKEAREYAEIDWHDFVVVETVVFTEADDEVELPPPTSLNDLQSASLEQKGAMSLRPHNMRIEEAMPFEEVAYNMSPPVPAQAPQPLATSDPSPAQELPEDILARERAANREAAQSASRAPSTSGPMRIRSDYVPKAQQRRPNVGQVICPNCNQPFPSDQINEHMRIELLDPRWQQQRAKAEGRAATTNLNTADFANNLKRLASQRSDVFDSATGQPLTPEESDRRKKQATGFANVPAQPQPGGTLDEQMARFQDLARNA